MKRQFRCSGATSLKHCDACFKINPTIVWYSHLDDKEGHEYLDGYPQRVASTDERLLCMKERLEQYHPGLLCALA